VPNQKKLNGLKVTSFDKLASYNTFKIYNDITDISDEALFDSMSDMSELSDNITHFKVDANSKCSGIGMYAFSNNPFVDIDLTNFSGDVGEGSFYLSPVTNFKIPDTIKNIYFASFGSFNNLKMQNFSFPDHPFGITNQYTPINTNNTKMIIGPVEDSEYSGLDPDTIVPIGSIAFGDVNYNELLQVGLSDLDVNELFYGTKITSVDLTNYNGSVGSAAFQNNSDLKEIKGLNDVTEIGNEAFADNPQVQQVTLPTNAQYTTISDELFQHSGLTSLTIPSNVVSIGMEAFVESANLKSVAIQYAATSTTKLTIGYGAFMDSQSLSDISLDTIDPANIVLLNSTLWYR
jgi:hypothetical protein